MVVGGKIKHANFATSGEIYDVKNNSWTLMDAELHYPDFEPPGLGGLTIIQNPQHGTRVFSAGLESYSSNKVVKILELNQEWKNWTDVASKSLTHAVHPLSYVVAYNYGQ